MTNFKGTKGKWVITQQLGSVITLGHPKIDVWERGVAEEMEANALLISKAPEMLEMLESCVLAFEQLGMKQPEGIKQLIKEATEL